MPYVEVELYGFRSDVRHLKTLKVGFLRPLSGGTGGNDAEITYHKESGHDFMRAVRGCPLLCGMRVFEPGRHAQERVVR